MISHSWDISPRQAIALQRELAGQIIVGPLAGHVYTVAGADCAMAARGGKIIAVAVLCDAASFEVIASSQVVFDCAFPYVPGLLSFREAPAVIEAVRRLPARPDLLMCDAQGLAHPRGLGLASHVGLWLDIPAIGAAKSRLCGRCRAPGMRRGCRTQLVHDGKVVGLALRTRNRVKPMYVSVGHRITLDEAARWVLRAARACRMPQPTRLAHQYVTRAKNSS